MASEGADPGSDHARGAWSAGGAAQHGAAAVQPADERFMRLAIEQAELAIDRKSVV